MALLLHCFNKEETGSDESIDSGYHGFDCKKGIGAFITSGTVQFAAMLGMELDEEMVSPYHRKKRNCSRDESGSSEGNSSSSSSDDEIDGEDSLPEKGVRIKNVHAGTFAQGFGLKNDDIILSINDKPIKSVKMLGLVIKRILKSSENCKLRMKIDRYERGLIVLDNGGDHICELSDNDMMCFDSTQSRLKNKHYRKYLMVNNSATKIGLSKHNTPTAKKMFTIMYYTTYYGEENTYENKVALKHNVTHKWIKYEVNGGFSLENPPEDGWKLSPESPFLFDMCPSSISPYKYFQPVTDTVGRLGFRGRRSSASLRLDDSPKSLFEIFS